MKHYKMAIGIVKIKGHENLKSWEIKTKRP
jgi:hypothetical protein